MYPEGGSRGRAQLREHRAKAIRPRPAPRSAVVPVEPVSVKVASRHFVALVTKDGEEVEVEVSPAWDVCGRHSLWLSLRRGEAGEVLGDLLQLLERIREVVEGAG